MEPGRPMRTSAYISLGLLAAGGGLAIHLLVPDNREMAFIHLKARDYALARREYQDLLAEGRNDVSLLVPMVNLSLRTGDLQTAARAMELMVAQYPRHVEARRQYGRILRFQHRVKDYFANLEVICELQPNEPDLVDLVRGWDHLAEPDRQIAALSRLADLRPDRADYAEHLAELQAARGRLPDAAATLRRLGDRSPEAMTEIRILLLVSLLMDANRPEEACKAAATWIEGRGTAEQASTLASFFAERGRTDLAIRLIEPRIDGELAARRDGTGAGPATNAVPDRLPNWILIDLGEAARGAGVPDLAAKASALLNMNIAGDPALFSAPGGREGPQGRSSAWSADEKAGIASLWMQAGKLEDARRLLLQVAADDDAPDWALDDLVAVSNELNRPHEALRVFEALRRSRSSPGVLAGWALLSTAAGAESPVVQWLESVPAEEPSDDLLHELCDLAGDRSLTNLTAAAAGRLSRRHPTSARRAQWIGALVQAGRTAEAMQALAGWSPDGAEAEAVYLEALQQAARAGLSVQGEAAAHCIPRLKRPGLDGSIRDDLLETLRISGAIGAAVPALQALVARDGGVWEEAYEDALRAAGLRAPLAALLAERTRRPGLPDDARRSLAYDLLDLGDKQAAIDTFLRLAENAPPDDPDVVELRYLWGPRPDAAPLDWMERRARSAATPDVQAAWLRMLLDSGGGDRVAAWIEGRGPAGAPVALPVLSACLDAVLETGDARQIDAAVGQVAGPGSPPEVLRYCAAIASEAGLDERAGQLYARLLSLVPEDGGAARELGLGAFRRDADAEARRFFARYPDAAVDAEVLYCLGVLAARSDSPGIAREHFDNALRLLGAGPTDSFERRLLRARVLRETGNRAAAVAELAALAADHPESVTVRTEQEEMIRGPSTPGP